MLEHPFQKELSSLPPQPKSTGLKLRLCLWLVSALVLLGISPTKENHCVHPSPSGSLALSHTGTQSKDLRPSFWFCHQISAFCREQRESCLNHMGVGRGGPRDCPE